MPRHHRNLAGDRPTGGSRPTVEPLENRQLLHGGVSDLHVQFGPAKTAPADGYVVDAGGTFAEHGHDLSYGWTDRRAAKPLARKASPLAPDARYNTLVSVRPDAAWEIAVPNGVYEVTLVAGDARAKRGAYGFDAEGTAALRGETTAEQRWVEGKATVEVTDGRLTITSAEGFRKNRLNFIDVKPVAPAGVDPPAPGPDPTPTPTPTPTPPSTPTPTPGGRTLGAWRAGAAAPVKRAEAVGAAVDGKLYVFGGIDGPGRNYAYPVTSRADVYDPAADRWSGLRLMPEAFTHTTGTVDGTTIWFAGGYVGDTPGPGTDHVWKYDTLTDTWTRGPNLPEPRGGGASAIAGRTLHYFGGTNEDRTADEHTHWSLDLDDPAATWVRRADMPVSPQSHGRRHGRRQDLRRRRAARRGRRRRRPGRDRRLRPRHRHLGRRRAPCPAPAPTRTAPRSNSTASSSSSAANRTGRPTRPTSSPTTRPPTPGRCSARCPIRGAPRSPASSTGNSSWPPAMPPHHRRHLDRPPPLIPPGSPPPSFSGERASPAAKHLHA
jgi:hypothetical protein